MVNSDAETSNLPNIRESIVKLKEIQLGLKKNLNKLHQAIKLLDSKPELQNSIEDLKTDAEIRANNLEAEVERLREDLKSIRELLDSNLEKRNSGKY